MSWPAEKAGPLAAITTARTLALSRMSFSAACSSAIRPSERLLRASGRLSVRTATLPIVSRSRTGDGDGAARAVWLFIAISIWGAWYPNVTSGERRGRVDRHGGCENERGRTGSVSGPGVSAVLWQRRDPDRKRRRRNLPAPPALQRSHAASGRHDLGTDADGAGRLRHVCGAAVGDRPGRPCRDDEP